MTRITREQFVNGLFDGDVDSGAIAVDTKLSNTLDDLGINARSLRDIAGRDGLVSSKKELARLFDLIDTIDHDGSRDSIAITTGDASGSEEPTSAGDALAVLANDLAEARLASRLGRPNLAAAAPAAQSALDLDEVAEDLARFEGSKSFMYQDSRGYVTTGVGHLLKTAADAEKLPWVNSATGEPATKAEIAAAFASVEDMPAGKRADRYRQDGGLVLAEGQAELLAAKRLEKEFLPGLRRLYPEFDAFPASAQRALIDMAYNCGLGGLAKFHHLADAVEKQDWTAAAAACNRKTCREERNVWTHDMFLTAANEARSNAIAP